MYHDMWGDGIRWYHPPTWLAHRYYGIMGYYGEYVCMGMYVSIHARAPYRHCAYHVYILPKCYILLWTYYYMVPSWWYPEEMLCIHREMDVPSPLQCSPRRRSPSPEEMRSTRTRTPLMHHDASHASSHEENASRCISCFQS